MTDNQFKDIFLTPKPIIGTLHLAGDDPVQRAVEELHVFEEEGLDGVIVENYHHKDPEVLAWALRIVTERAHLVPVGVNVLPNEFQESIPLAAGAGALFIQLDHVAGRYSHGSLDDHVAQYNTLRFHYPHIAVLGGVHPKYYTPAPGSNLEKDLQTGKERADAIVVTGAGTGMETPLDKITQFRSILGEYPLIVGAGLTHRNAYEQLKIADGAIVGSCLKADNDTSKELDVHKIRDLMQEVYRARETPISAT